MFLSPSRKSETFYHLGAFVLPLKIQPKSVALDVWNIGRIMQSRMFWHLVGGWLSSWDDEHSQPKSVRRWISCGVESCSGNLLFKGKRKRKKDRKCIRQILFGYEISHWQCKLVLAKSRSVSSVKWTLTNQSRAEVTWKYFYFFGVLGSGLCQKVLHHIEERERITRKVWILD